MPDPHWENLKEMFHAALALPPNQRAAYLELASRGDPALRQAVESLLRSHEETNHFVDEPVFQAAAEMVVDASALKPHQSVAHYRIVSLLGEGGMGKVYLADDTKLHRRVSLKFLPRNFTQDRERLLRFEQEARAASALNHPNILTIYEFSEAEGHRFIATEFIEGQTLRRRLQSRLSLDEVLEIAIQVASALVAAHRVKIVHRDIKPENIMIRGDDDLVKVLDFGLAKVSDGGAADGNEKNLDHEAPTQFKTGPGVVMGTAAYMSPEQARGEAVDERTDIWSLGAMVYEMITGSSPFIATTSNEIIAAILSKAPAPPLSRYADDVPERLEEIVEKTLAKNRDERYQTSKDLLIDLKRLRQSLDLRAGLERNRVPEKVSAATAGRDDVISTKDVTGSASVINEPKSTMEGIARQVKTHKRGALVFASFALLAVVAAITMYEWRVRRAIASAPVPQIKSLAVLPLKSLDKNDDYVGAAIADAVIRRLSQAGQLAVKPTSAVLKFVKDDTDSLSAAHQLNADAVLEGTIQRAGDRLRVSVNLLRTADGSSLWADNFDSSAEDMFAMQDKVGNEVAKRLELPLLSAQARLNNKYPASPVAYESYIKGVYSLDERSYGPDAMPQMQETINYFKKAIEVDPDYALAHAQLAFAYIWTAMSIDPRNEKWAELGREEIARAQTLGPQLPETHYAHGLLLWTAFGGYQNREAIRELLVVRRLDPYSAHPDLAAIYMHAGLDDLAATELKRALDIDPTSKSLRYLTQVFPYLQAKPDEWLAAEQKLHPDAQPDVWYWTRKGKLDEAEKLNKQDLSDHPNSVQAQIQQALILSLKGDSKKAVTGVPELMTRIPINDQLRHHATYDAACIYALAGQSQDAVKWLRETANTGFPNYPLFERDAFLNRIRQSPEFIQFMAEQKAQWEQWHQEFGN